MRGERGGEKVGRGAVDAALEEEEVVRDKEKEEKEEEKEIGEE